MNQSVLRLLLSCFLLITLPVQGVAATSMMACGTNHHRIDGLGGGVDAPAPAQIHHHDEGVSHRHPVGQPSPSEMDDRASSDGATIMGEASRSSVTFKCNACAPCCSGAALTGAVSVTVVPPPSTADFATSTSVHPSAPIGRLDRPPRLILA